MEDFTTNPDAVVEADGGWWFFKGAHCVKVAHGQRDIVAGPLRIGTEDAWPALADTMFAQDLDAVSHFVNTGPGPANGWWFFKDAYCIEIDADAGTTILHPRSLITDTDLWPSLADVKVTA